YKDDAARHQAVKELGKHKTPHAHMALRQILVESTGNAYLRRKAAQAIKESFPREEACAIFAEISTMEADNNFLLFLADMIEDNCE
ncbi:MAG: HEAT repeat protein, partial [Candidatus Paceibacteria bacterium]